jgi:hypothetical protein
MLENWRPVMGYGDAYSVSDLGRVMRTAPRKVWQRPSAARGSRAKPFEPSECRSYLNRSGYPQVRIGPSGAQRTVSVHRLVALAFVPNPRGVRCVNHIDGDKTNNRPANLEWVTHSENITHALRTGLCVTPKGEAHGNAKLSEADVRAIRSDTRVARVVAIEYGVDLSLIYMVRHRQIWKHVA